jgi:hypothetical protein
MTELGQNRNVAGLMVLRGMFVDLGAKKKTELSSQELAAYQ